MTLEKLNEMVQQYCQEFKSNIGRREHADDLKKQLQIEIGRMTAMQAAYFSLQMYQALGDGTTNGEWHQKRWSRFLSDLIPS